MTKNRYTERKKEPDIKAPKIAGASNLGGQSNRSLSNYIQQHRLAIQSAFYRMGRSRMATIMTIVVIGIALALPATLKVFLSNAQQFQGDVDQQAQITVFLKSVVHGTTASRLVSKLREREDIDKIEYVSSQAAFNEFKQLSGFGEALEGLKRNPLPGLLIIYPKISDQQGRLDTLVQHLRDLPESDTVQLDKAWLQRLFAILDLIRQASLLITVFLIIAVIMVVGNTIRLMSQSYQEEIEVNKLVGATDGFVRRPFLYSGVFYGLFGALIAWALITFSLLWLNPGINQLSNLYHGAFAIQGLDFDDALTLLATGILLGFGGSWIAVGRFLRETNP